MNPAHLKKLSEMPITLALNGRQWRLLSEWLQVEALERTQELPSLQPDCQAYAQTMQQLHELDEVLAAISAAYRQAAEKLNLALD
jgi:hypothetical protein